MLLIFLLQDTQSPTAGFGELWVSWEYVAEEGAAPPTTGGGRPWLQAAGVDQHPGQHQ